MSKKEKRELLKQLLRGEKDFKEGKEYFKVCIYCKIRLKIRINLCLNLIALLPNHYLPNNQNFQKLSTSLNLNKAL